LVIRLVQTRASEALALVVERVQVATSDGSCRTAANPTGRESNGEWRDGEIRRFRHQPAIDDCDGELATRHDQQQLTPDKRLTGARGARSDENGTVSGHLLHVPRASGEAAEPRAAREGRRQQSSGVPPPPSPPMSCPLDLGFGPAVSQPVPAKSPAHQRFSGRLAHARTAVITPIRRGRLPPSSCRHEPVTRQERLSSRRAFTIGRHLITRTVGEPPRSRSLVTNSREGRDGNRSVLPGRSPYIQRPAPHRAGEAAAFCELLPAPFIAEWAHRGDGCLRR
jgi:hypothetical protein